MMARKTTSLSASVLGPRLFNVRLSLLLDVHFTFFSLIVFPLFVRYLSFSWAEPSHKEYFIQYEAVKAIIHCSCSYLSCVCSVWHRRRVLWRVLWHILSLRRVGGGMHQPSRKYLLRSVKDRHTRLSRWTFLPQRIPGRREHQRFVSSWPFFPVESWPSVAGTFYSRQGDNDCGIARYQTDYGICLGADLLTGGTYTINSPKPVYKAAGPPGIRHPDSWYYRSNSKAYYIRFTSTKKDRALQKFIKLKNFLLLEELITKNYDFVKPAESGHAWMVKGWFGVRRLRAGVNWLVCELSLGWEGGT